MPRRGRWRLVVSAIAIGGALALAFVAGFSVRGRGEPAANRTSNPVETAATRFAQEMSVHHAQAVDMAERIRVRTSDAGIAVLATDIVLTQQAQIGRFQGWLESWGEPLSAPHEASLPASNAGSVCDLISTETTGITGMTEMTGMTGMTEMTEMDHSADPGDEAMPGMATRAQVSELSTLGVLVAEQRFLVLMIAHHRGGVAMAERAEPDVNRPEVQRMITKIIAGQSTEIAAMSEMLKTRKAT